MRSGGDIVVVGIKDAAKLIGISIISCCAVLVCTLFLNFHTDIVGIKDVITSERAMAFYEAQVSTSKVVCIVSGGCLLITSVIMLIFYIKHYIDTHKKELGILKALGYSNIRVAKNFYVFGLSVLVGAGLGFGGAFLLMPSFYALQNEDKILPEITMNFHTELLVFLVVLPTVLFAILSVCFAAHALKKPALALLKDSVQTSAKAHKAKPEKDTARSFVDDMKKSTLKSKKSLVFFMIFASFCFSAMTQMSAAMKDLSSAMMGVMILLIGLVLAFTTLFIAITTVINGNTKTIAMMRVFGYSQKDCCKALLGGYRPLGYIGFTVGTVYQYALLKIMVDIVFKDIENVPEYKFDLPVMLLSLAAFIIFYEIVMYVYSERIKSISVKEIMSE